MQQPAAQHPAVKAGPVWCQLSQSVWFACTHAVCPPLLQVLNCGDPSMRQYLLHVLHHWAGVSKLPPYVLLQTGAPVSGRAVPSRAAGPGWQDQRAEAQAWFLR